VPNFPSAQARSFCAWQHGEQITCGHSSMFGDDFGQLIVIGDEINNLQKKYFEISSLYSSYDGNFTLTNSLIMPNFDWNPVRALYAFTLRWQTFPRERVLTWLSSGSHCDSWLLRFWSLLTIGGFTNIISASFPYLSTFSVNSQLLNKFDKSNSSICCWVFNTWNRTKR